MHFKNIEAIRKELISGLGAEKVLNEDFILASYTVDGTLFYYPLSTPSLVVLPHSTEDVQKIIQIANQHKIPVVPSGGRTNSWGAVDSNGGIAIDMCNMNKVIEIDKKNLTFTVQAGVNVHHMNKDLLKMGFCYPTHPLNFAPISFGAEVSKNSGGEAGCMYGHAAKRIIGLKVVLGNGDILETGSSRVIRNVPYFQQSGIPDLTHLFVAAEGAYGVITEVTMGMQMVPVSHMGMDIKFEGTLDGFRNGVEVAQELRTRKGIACNAHLVDHYCMWMFERGGAGKGVEVDEEVVRKQLGHILIVEIESFVSEEECNLKKQAILEICKRHGGEYHGENMAKAFESIMLGDCLVTKALFSESSPMVPFWADVPYESVLPFYEKVLELLDRNHWPRKTAAFIGAFGDDSCLTFFFNYPNPHDAEDVRKSIDVNKKIIELYTEVGVIPYRIGRMWRPYIMDKLDPTYLTYIRSLKKQFDPNNIMNPGVSVFEEATQ